MIRTVIMFLLKLYRAKNFQDSFLCCLIQCLSLEATSRLPLIAVTAGRIKAKERLHRIHARVMLYSDFRLVANNSTSRLYATVVSFPCPPVVEKTSCVNTAYSTSLILSPYSLFFAFSCCL